MSVWGTGPFDNDDAAAWSDELDDIDGAADAAAFAERTLRSGDEPGRVVAAAAWLASGVPGVPDPVDGPTTPPPTPDADLADAAAGALGTVLADDEWAHQWSDPAEREAVRAYVRSLIETWEVTIG